MKTTARLLLTAVGLLWLVSQSIAATITWDGGGGDSNWHNPLNWSGDQVPGIGDDVVVDSNVTTEVRSSVTTRGFRLVNGASLRVRGAGTRFTAEGETTIESANLYVMESAIVTLPRLERLTDDAACCGQELFADGPGSVLDLSAVTFLDGGNSLDFRATGAGRVLLPHVPQTSGHTDFTADGEGSLVDLSSLRFLVANNGSSIVARNHGVVALPADFNATGIEFSGVTLGITFPQAPLITQQPADQMVPLNGTGSFTVIATGTPPISYRWQWMVTQENGRIWLTKPTPV